MDTAATASSLLEALQSTDYQGLYHRFYSFLLPFGDFTTLNPDNPITSASAASGDGTKKRTTTRAPRKRAQLQAKKKKPETDPRSIAKRYLPFLCSALRILPTLLRKGSAGGQEDDGERALELLGVYRIALDCLGSISPCLAGKPYSVHLQRARLVSFLESWGRYSEAEEEGVSLLESLRSVLVSAASAPKKAREVTVLLPDPETVGADPDIASLAVEVISSLVGCAFKREVKEGAAYQRILSLVDQVQPWLRLVDPVTTGKYQLVVVNALCRCSVFLAREASCFTGDLVRSFCLRTLKECLGSTSRERFPIIARKICSSIDLQSESGPLLIFDTLELATGSILCECQIAVVKDVNGYIEVVSSCADIFCSASIDLCSDASKLLHKKGYDFLQVSPAIGSILILYAIGLHFKVRNTQGQHCSYMHQKPVNASKKVLLDNGKNLQYLSDSIIILGRHFQIAGFEIDATCELQPNNHRNLSSSDVTLDVNSSCSCRHGNASFLSYFDALEFLCKLLVEHVTAAWNDLVSVKEALIDLDEIVHIQNSLNQFCEIFCGDFRPTNISEKDKERLLDAHSTLLQVTVATIKIFLLNKGNKRSLELFNHIVTSKWIEPQGLKFLSSSLHNIAALLYNIGHLEQASIALRFCHMAIWLHFKLHCSILNDKAQHGDKDDISCGEIVSVAADAFARSATILDVLHKCGSTNIHEIVVETLFNFFIAGSTVSCESPGISLVLMKQWVKVLCKDFKGADSADKAPVLYTLLINYCSTWPKRTLGTILEQELLSYEVLEAANANFCRKMQLKVIDIFLNEIYTTNTFYLERSKFLVKKGKILRATGVEGSKSCMKCLSEAILSLEQISSTSSSIESSISKQLGFTYCLRAQCAQEANNDNEMILNDVQSALNFWTTADVLGHQSSNLNDDLAAGNAILLLCNIADLLSLKGCLKYQFDIYKLIIRLNKRDNSAIENCLSMLWMGRRLSHALCSFPIDRDFILNMSKDLGSSANSIHFWMNCLKGCNPSLLGFCYKFLLVDTTVSGLRREPNLPFGSKATSAEVKSAAASLLSVVPLASQPAFIAGHLYYDLSERLLSIGQLFEALIYAKKSLHLRRKILRKKFVATYEQQPANCVDSGKTAQNGVSHVWLEALGSVITEVWPVANRLMNTEESVLSPWNVLRCYLESILQVGSIHESTGNHFEAEILLEIGKRICDFQGVPVLGVAFHSLLGQLYRKQQRWELAENAFNAAHNLLLKNDAIISCKHCKLAFETTIDMHTGDLKRNMFDKGLRSQSVTGLSHALGFYRSALRKLNHPDFESYLSTCEKPGAIGTTYDRVYFEDVAPGDFSLSDLQIRMEETKSLACGICSSSSGSSIHLGKQMPLVHEDCLHICGEDGGLSLEIQKNSWKYLRCSSKKQTLDAETKARGNSSSKCLAYEGTGNKVNKKVDDYCKTVGQKICHETIGLAKQQNVKADFRHSEANERDQMKRWKCFLSCVTEGDSLQNVTFIKWEFKRRHLMVRLRLKLARCLMENDNRNGRHEVHEQFFECISLLFYLKSFSETSSCISYGDLIELIVEENPGVFFSIEHAAILYHMSWLSLKDHDSNSSRTRCCCLANIQMPKVLHWLLKAFMLSRELPSLFQKVSKLLACLLLISTINGPMSLPHVFGKSFSISHWAAFFHQVSIGAHILCQYSSCLTDKALKTLAAEGYPAAFMEALTKASGFLRCAPDRIEQLEEFVKDYYESLPNVPIIGTSMLGGDYLDLVGEALLLPSFFPAWMLLSRLHVTGRPLIMLLPVDFVQEGIPRQDSVTGNETIDGSKGLVGSWECPWGSSIVDYVAPTYKMVLEENFTSLSSTNCTPDEAAKYSISWWTQRTRLNNRLNLLLRGMEDSWLGPWRCLLLGEPSDYKYLEIAVPKLMKELKFQYKCEANDELLKVILGGSKSAADAEACMLQLLSYNGYFGRGACCGGGRFRAFFTAGSRAKTLSESVQNLIQEAVCELKEPVDRNPVILVLDSDVQMLPWENLPVLRSHEVYRMPSVGCMSITLSRRGCNERQDGSSVAAFPSIDPSDVYYLLNPSGDLSSTQIEFERWFKNQKWEGHSGKAPSAEELVAALQNHDLFLYFGHGSGTQYISEHKIQKLDKCAATLLMGCSSGALVQKGSYAPQGAPLSYLFAGSPAVIANLWDVTDKDIDRFGKAILNSWLQDPDSPSECPQCSQIASEMECLSINNGDGGKLPRTKRAASKGKKGLKPAAIGKMCERCTSRKRIASNISGAREACRLPLLIGAAAVCYGVPTTLRKNSCDD